MLSRTCRGIPFTIALGIVACCCPVPVDAPPEAAPAGPTTVAAEPALAAPVPPPAPPEPAPLPPRDWPDCGDIGYQGVKMLGFVDPARERQQVRDGVRYEVTRDRDDRLVFTGDDGSTHTVRMSGTWAGSGSVKTFAFGAETAAVLAPAGAHAVELLLIDPERWRLLERVSLALTDNPERRSNSSPRRVEFRFGVDDYALAVEDESILNWFQVDESGEVRGEKHLYTSTYVRPKLAMVDGTWAVLAGKLGDSSGYHHSLLIDPASGEDAVEVALWAKSGVGNALYEEGDLVGRDGAWHLAGWHGGGKFTGASTGQIFHIPASGGDVETQLCELPR